MKYIMLAMLFLIACEEDTITCQIRTGDYVTFDRDEIDNCSDKDGDGVPFLEDCNDLDERFGNKEIPNDLIDNDCDGKVDEPLLPGIKGDNDE